MPKERLYDSLTDEEIDMFGFFADRAVVMLKTHMLAWKQHFGFRSSRRSRQTARMVAWAKYQLMLEGSKIPAERLQGFRAPKNPESTERGRALSEIYNRILPNALQGEEYVDACRKISSIMSMRTWARRQQRKRYELENPPAPKKRHAPTLPEKRAKWQATLDARPREQQADLGLIGIGQAVHETPVASLPPQTAVQEPAVVPIERQLADQVIMNDAYFEQKKHGDSYPKKKSWFPRPRKRRRYSRY